MQDLSSSLLFFLFGNKTFPLTPSQRSCFDSCFWWTWGSLPAYSLGLSGCLSCQPWKSQEGVSCNQCTRHWGGPPGVTHQCSSTRRRPVGSHHAGSCPCGNLWQVGSEMFTSGNKEWVGKFHFKPNSLYLLALPRLKGESVGGLLRPPGRGSLRFLGLCLPPVG